MRSLLLCFVLALGACSDDANDPDIDAGDDAPDAQVNPMSDASVAPDAQQNFGEPPGLEGVTQAHNEVRAMVGVGPMTWNEDLAATAQAWAESCVDNDAPAGLIDHNDDRSVGHPYYVGENVYGSSGNATGVAAVNSWASEGADYDYNTNSCAPGRVCGHYTQIVWATSVELGCGIASCPGLTYSNGVVCNYGPGGNSGGPPY